MPRYTNHRLARINFNVYFDVTEMYARFIGAAINWPRRSRQFDTFMVHRVRVPAQRYSSRSKPESLLAAPAILCSLHAVVCALRVIKLSISQSIEYRIALQCHVRSKHTARSFDRTLVTITHCWQCWCRRKRVLWLMVLAKYFHKIGNVALSSCTFVLWGICSRASQSVYPQIEYIIYTCFARSIVNLNRLKQSIIYDDIRNTVLEISIGDMP